MLTNEKLEEIGKEYLSAIGDIPAEILVKAEGKVQLDNGTEFEVNGVLFSVGKFPYSPYPHLAVHLSQGAHERGCVIFSKAEHYGEAFDEYNLKGVKANAPTVFDLADFEKFKKDLKITNEVVKEPYLDQLKKMEDDLSEYKKFLKDAKIVE
jgi:hypothetical protein